MDENDKTRIDETTVMTPPEQRGDGDKDAREDATVTLLGRKFRRSRAIAAGICGVVLVAGIGCGIAWGMGGTAQPATDPEPVAGQQEASAAEEPVVERWLSIGVAADGWDAETSSPVIAHVTSADGAVDFYHAYAANGTERLLVADAGDYQVSWITPVNADGSMYRVCDPTTVTAQEREVAGDAAEADASAAEPSQEGGDAPELPYAFERV